MPSLPNRQRAAIAVVEVLALSAWFSATAVVPSLRWEWGIGATAAVWLTASVQIGFVVGAITSTITNLADRTSPPRLLAASAAGAASCTAVLALSASGLAAAIPLRFFTGIFLAGVYPVGMKLMASWSASSDRGRTFGVLLAALTIGSALPHLVTGLGPLPWRTVMLAAAALTAAGAVVAITAVGAGPHLVVRVAATKPRYALTLLTDRTPRLASLGYFGHMWELYALWTWLPVFVITGRDARGNPAPGCVGFIAFGAIGVAGAVGCLLGGWASDRYGRAPSATAALMISGACCAASPLFFACPTPLLVVFLLVWGTAAIADSGVFSTVLSESADERFVGTALTAQTATGFLLTVVTIQLVPVVAGLIGWQYAFVLLAPGPLLGAVAMSALLNHHQSEEENDDHQRAHDPVRRSNSAALAHCR